MTDEAKKPKKKQILFKREHLQKHPHAKWLNTAIRSNRWGKEKTVNITYKKLNGDVVERKVRPVGTRGEHLIAHDYHRDGIRSFHVGRIEKMEKSAFMQGFANKAREFGRKAAPIAAGAGIGAVAGGAISGGTAAIAEGVNKAIEGKKYDKEYGKKYIKFRTVGGAIAGGVLGGMAGHDYAKFRGTRGQGGYAPPPPVGDFTREHASHLGFDKGMPNTKAEARARFRHAARMNHPDLGGNSENMKKINDAWERFEKSPHFSKLAQMLFARIQMENA